MEDLKKIDKTISYSMPATIVLEDAIEGDMTFHFSLIKTKDDNSYTNYYSKTPHDVYIEVSNVFRGKSVHLVSPIHIGTYSSTYNLYLSFVISKENENDERIISVTFLIEKK